MLVRWLVDWLLGVLTWRLISPLPGIETYSEDFPEHIIGILDRFHLAAIRVIPVDRDFHDPHIVSLGYEKDFHIEAPSTDGLKRKQVASCLVPEALKASLSVLDAMHG